MLLSIDVGIKNLSMCLIQASSADEWKIVKWDNINLLQSKPNCCSWGECKKPAKWISPDGVHYYCGLHSKKNKQFIMPQAWTSKALNKQSLEELKQLMLHFHIPDAELTNKKACIQSIKQFGENTCLRPLKPTKVGDVDLVLVCRNLTKCLSEWSFQDIEHLIIENQLASKMQHIQWMIVQYFMVNNPNVHVELINASNKLKDVQCETELDKYANRKKESVTACAELLKWNSEEWNVHFSKHKKKDDLADCLLQGLWYVRHRLF